MNKLTIEFHDGTANFFRSLAPGNLRRGVLDAAAQALRNAAKEHFLRRNAEPSDNSGFPRFGQTWPKRNFWAGTKGDSVAEKIKEPVIDTAAGEATIPIDSPALAHKADPDPPPITPKGGRRYLAIPANPAAAAWRGMPRDFKVSGGMKFGYAPTPEGRWLPALVANDNWFRRQKNGKDTTRGKADRGARQPLFWLVRKVQTRHDPRAMPPHEGLESAALAAAQNVLATLLQEK